MAVYVYLWSDEQGESVDKVQQHGLTCQDWQYVFEWIEVEWCVLPITGFELKDKP